MPNRVNLNITRVNLKESINEVDKILKDDKFIAASSANIGAVLDYVLGLGYGFGIVARMDQIKFDPPLPEEILKSFKMPAIFLQLEEYTLSSAHLSKDELVFEAGFGPQDFASTLSVPFYAVLQIVVDGKPIAVNFSQPESEWLKREKSRKIFSK